MIGTKENRVTWWDRNNDPALANILESGIKAAGHDQPNVLISPGELRPEFAELVALTLQRILNLQVEAILAVASDVEFVLANAPIVAIDDFHALGLRIPALVESRDSRARARRLELRERVWQAEQRVATATEAHSQAVKVQVNYGLGAIARLDAAIRRIHRFSSFLTYLPPTKIAVSETAIEIGLTRVHAALTGTKLTTNKEGAA
jgi:hypothetical protein